ncbi:hypothetical protein GGQ74_002374 [Desulfobaculum xiamenense]|uniref:Uncharacterized protein n=1 Tax=Desulfobaculum xiamenense TaxID=995050 RepID=A0A846QKP7_9BACT|nr:hypothetical protein [Desulfobaculum xiamenense]NJB68701.1 hypothetical protein [Desulfobaculum xiamenense]
MENGRTVYEGWVFGIGEWAFSKIHKLLENAFETVSYTYQDKTGAVFVSGPSAMFEDDMENMTSVFDLLADVIEENGHGTVLGRRWTSDGALELAAYDFGSKNWNRRELAA